MSLGIHNSQKPNTHYNMVFSFMCEGVHVRATMISRLIDYLSSIKLIYITITINQVIVLSNFLRKYVLNILIAASQMVSLVFYDNKLNILGL